MKKQLLIISIGIFTILLSCSNSTDQVAEATFSTTEQNVQAKTINQNVDVNQFAELIAKGNGQVLDVRTPQEWATGTIKGAKKMNLFDADFNAQLKTLDKNKPVYVYCKSGGRSGKAAKQLEKMGFKTVYNLIGGITAWKAAGKEVSK